nr:glycosyltransferase [Grimontia sedimenti]
MKIANKVLLYTDYEREKLKKKHNNIYSLNNGLDSKEIRSCFPKGYINDANSKGERLNALFIGRLTAKSDIKFVLRAMHEVSDCISLHIIGDGPCYNEVETYLNANGLNGVVKLYGNVTSESEIASIATKCDFFVYSGSVGLSLIHAFNYGLPAIVHDDRQLHMPEFSALVEGYNGWTFPKGNLGELISKMKAYNELSIEERILFKKNSLDTISISYNSDDMYKRFSNVISG